MPDSTSANPAEFLVRDLRYAVRRLRKNPGFTATAVLSLAIGIGAGTAMFSIVNAVMIRDLPLLAPEELVAVYMNVPDFEYNVFSYPDYRDLRDGTTDVFSGLAATRLIITQVDQGDTVEMIPGEAVTGNIFTVLGVDAHIGRTLLASDDVAAGAHPIVMLSYSYWQSRYAGDPGVVGSDIRLAGRPYTIVGVAPRDYPGWFRGIVPAFFAPVMMINQLEPATYDELESRGNHSSFVTGRLRPGVNMTHAQAALDRVGADLHALDLDDLDPDARFYLIPQQEIIVFPPLDRFIRAASWLVMVVVSLVLVMTTTNLASFLLARTLDRRKEIAVRLALGASRRSIASQLLIETSMLGVLGGVAGVSLAWFLLRLLLRLDLPLPVPLDFNLRLDGTVLAFSFVVSLAAGLLLGMAPALQNRRWDMAATIRAEDAGGGRGGKLRLRNALVVSQVAISIFLLLGAGLFARSMARMEAVDPGFGAEPTAVVDIVIPANKYDEDEGREMMRRVVERYRQIPGVEAVGLTGNIPLNTLSRQTTNISVDGVDPPPGREYHPADRTSVDGGFFSAMGIRILDGRGFDDRDRRDTDRVAIVSQAMARKFWPEGSAVGQVVHRPQDLDDLRIVGVARDVKVRSLGEAPRSFLYTPLSQNYTSFMTAVVRTRMDAEQTVLDVVDATREIDSDMYVWQARTMTRHLEVHLLPARLSATVLAAFAAVALTLVVIGLYGVVGYAAAQRRREVGIRMSLGATESTIVRLLMSTGLRLVLIGGVIGLLVTILASRLVSSLLFEVSPLDPLTFAVVLAMLVGVTAVSTLFPAWTASRVDPAKILRAE
jgi:predicted permease